MLSNSYLLVLVACLSSAAVHAAPLLGHTDGFCSGEDTLKYQNQHAYYYRYTTNTQLWINNVSDESKSSAELSALVEVSKVSPCGYTLRLTEVKLTGDSVTAGDDLELLSANEISFQMNARGELHPEVGFIETDPVWSRNVKRGVLSALQTKSVNDLRQLEDGQATDKSATIYETDVLGRCRTTYDLKSNADSKVVLKKTKSLQGCTLNGNKKTSAVQFTTYRTLPVNITLLFLIFRLFVLKYDCLTLTVLKSKKVILPR
jgi:hypothetical protein